MNDDEIERHLAETALEKVEADLTSGDADRVVETLRDLASVERTVYVWAEGVYQGVLVTYTNPLMPALREVFHPYVPLSFYGASPSPHAIEKNGYWYEEPTVQFFQRHGFPVPPGAPD